MEKAFFAKGLDWESSPGAFTKEQFQQVLDEAELAGREAVAGMRDGFPCGGAYLTAHSNVNCGFIIKLFKKYGVKEGEGSNAKYKIGNWTMMKDYPTGFWISNSANGGYQNMDMHSAENNAYVRVFAKYNIVVGVRTYID